MSTSILCWLYLPDHEHWNWEKHLCLSGLEVLEAGTSPEEGAGLQQGRIKPTPTEKKRWDTEDPQKFQEYGTPGTGCIPRLLSILWASGVIAKSPLGKLQIDFCHWSSRVLINTSNVSKTIYGKISLKLFDCTTLCVEWHILLHKVFEIAEVSNLLKYKMR